MDLLELCVSLWIRRRRLSESQKKAAVRKAVMSVDQGGSRDRDPWDTGLAGGSGLEIVSMETV